MHCSWTTTKIPTRSNRVIHTELWNTDIPPKTIRPQTPCHQQGIWMRALRAPCGCCCHHCCCYCCCWCQEHGGQSEETQVGNHQTEIAAWKKQTISISRVCMCVSVSVCVRVSVRLDCVTILRVCGHRSNLHPCLRPNERTNCCLVPTQKIRPSWTRSTRSHMHTDTHTLHTPTTQPSLPPRTWTLSPE